MTVDPRPGWAIRLQTEREAREWSKPDMARALFKTAGVRPNAKQVESLSRQIRGYEKGRYPRDWASTYAVAFGLAERDLFPDDDHADHDEDRRRLLACLGVLGVGTASRADPLEPIRRALAAALPSGLQGHVVRDWEEVAFEHGQAFLTTAPDVLLPDLAADLIALLDSVKSSAVETTRQDLCVSAGKMAALVAMTVATLGRHRHARDWWRTARRTADASSDRDLRVWVRGYEAMSALYSGRPLPVVLRLSDEAIALAGGGAGAAVLEAMAARAQALSLTSGHVGEATRAMHALEQRWCALPAAMPDDRLATGAWPETTLHHTASFVYTHVGAHRHDPARCAHGAGRRPGRRGSPSGRAGLPCRVARR